MFDGTDCSLALTRCDLLVSSLSSYLASVPLCVVFIKTLSNTKTLVTRVQSSGVTPRVKEAVLVVGNNLTVYSGA